MVYISGQRASRWDEQVLDVRRSRSGQGRGQKGKTGRQCGVESCSHSLDQLLLSPRVEILADSAFDVWVATNNSNMTDEAMMHTVLAQSVSLPSTRKCDQFCITRALWATNSCCELLLYLLFPT